MQDRPDAAAPGAAIPGQPLPAAAPPRPAGPEHPLHHDGRFGELFVLFLINLLFTILTLGIYRFWGKTRIRRYVWSRTSLMGERFEYTGTGLELFVGFLFALLFLAPPIGLLVWWQIEHPPRPDDLAGQFLFIIILYVVVLISFLLYYVALFAVYRYRLSRTSWYGVRGAMEGSAWLYGLLGLGLGLLNGLSLGWTKPWADTVVFRYRLGRAYFGDRRMSANYRAGKLYPSFTLVWLVCAVAAAIAIGYITYEFMKLVEQLRRGADPSPGELAQIQYKTIAAYLVPILAWLFMSPLYKAALLKEIAEGTTIGEERVHARATFTRGQFWMLAVPNALILLFTLGLLFPYVVLRTARFIARHVVLVGPIDPDRIQQSPYRGPRVGEGLAEFMGFGGI